MISKLKARDCNTNARQEMFVAQCREYTKLISGFQNVKAKFRGCTGVHLTHVSCKAVLVVLEGDTPPVTY